MSTGGKSSATVMIMMMIFKLAQGGVIAIGMMPLGQAPGE